MRFRYIRFCNLFLNITITITSGMLNGCICILLYSLIVRQSQNNIFKKNESLHSGEKPHPVQFVRDHFHKMNPNATWIKTHRREPSFFYSLWEIIDSKIPWNSMNHCTRVRRLILVRFAGNPRKGCLAEDYSVFSDTLYISSQNNVEDKAIWQ